MNKKGVFCIVFCLFLIGCGAKHPILSDAHQSAVKFNQRAESSFKSGDYENALRLYNEALKINRSIENINGIAINIINMTATYRKLGDKGNAHKQIDEILNASPIAYNPIHLSEAAFLKAMLYFDEKNYDKALEWIDRSLSFCRDAGCSNEGKIYNLKGRISLSKGDIASAIAYGNKGLELNKEDKHKNEKANSLRLIADAKAIKGEYEDAQKFYEEALLIDKTLGVSKKIAQDLIGIGNVFLKQGNCESATAYFKRALSVSEGAGDKEKIAEAKDMIEKCVQKKNEIVETLDIYPSAGSDATSQKLTTTALAPVYISGNGGYTASSHLIPKSSDNLAKPSKFVIPRHKFVIPRHKFVIPRLKFVIPRHKFVIPRLDRGIHTSKFPLTDWGNDRPYHWIWVKGNSHIMPFIA